MDNTELMLKENCYIEGLCAALSAVQGISAELVADLEQDLNDALMESDGLFAALRPVAVEAGMPVAYNLFIAENEEGDSFFPIFTNPEYLLEFLAPIDYIDENMPFCMVRFEQIAEMLQTFAEDDDVTCPGIILNAGREEELACSMDTVNEAIDFYHKTHDHMTDEERDSVRVLWCLDDSGKPAK